MKREVKSVELRDYKDIVIHLEHGSYFHSMGYENPEFAEKMAKRVANLNSTELVITEKGVKI